MIGAFCNFHVNSKQRETNGVRVQAAVSGREALRDDPNNGCEGDYYTKAAIKVFLADHTVAMVAYYMYVMERTTSCSPIVGQFFDTMIVASSDREWL